MLRKKYFKLFLFIVRCFLYYDPFFFCISCFVKFGLVWKRMGKHTFIIAWAHRILWCASSHLVVYSIKLLCFILKADVRPFNVCVRIGRRKKNGYKYTFLSVFIFCWFSWFSLVELFSRTHATNTLSKQKPYGRC